MINFSMRTSLLLTIVLMGVLSIGFTLFSGEVYLRQTLNNWQESFTEVAELEVHNRWDKLKRETANLGLSVQASENFRQAFKQKNIDHVTSALDEHFSRAYVTLGILNLKDLIAFDKNYQRASKAFDSTNSGQLVCPKIFEKAKQRKGTSRYKLLHQTCNVNNELRLISLVPIGGLRLSGYLAVVVDPLHNLAAAEEGIGMPLMVKSDKNHLLYKSTNWPEEKTMKNVMMVHYSNKAGNEKPVANFYFATDVTELKQRLLATRVSLISVVILATLIAMLIATWLFRKTIIKPLNKITEYFHRIHVDKKQLDEVLKVKGSRELEVLADNLNSMTKELSRLYRDFEEMAFTDSLTGIPNRALLFDRLRQITLFASRDKTQSEFMLLMMDLNKFKAVNDELGHHVGDELLVQVADRLQRALRESDTIARLGGDEFSAILYGLTDRQEAIRMADKITAIMNELFEIEGYKIEVGMSIGIARYPHDGSNSEEIMHAADMAMYHAKRNKLPYVFYETLIE